MKKKVMFLMIMVMSILMSMTAFAGVWRTGASPNENRWWYDNEDGTWAEGGWQWIDGNQDGTAECYYFDSEGWMAADTMTPDGYQVNGDGAWVENGLVMTQAVSLTASSTHTEEGGSLVVYFSRPVLTFLEAYDWSGKTVVPFCTSGGSGISASLGEIRESCSGADVEEGRRVNDTSSIEPWLRSLGLIS